MILTTSEFNSRKDQVLRVYASAWHDDMVRQVWLTAPKGISKHQAKLLWLFVFVLNGYEHGGTDNYVTEDQVMKIFAKANSIQ